MTYHFRILKDFLKKFSKYKITENIEDGRYFYYITLSKKKSISVEFNPYTQVIDGFIIENDIYEKQFKISSFKELKQFQSKNKW